MTRWFVGGLGVLVMGYGLAGALADPDVSAGGVLVFAVAALAGHDGVLLPLAIGAGALAVRVVPAGRGRAVVQAALFATAVLLFVGAPLVLGFGRAADNPSALPRDYGRGMLILLAAVWAAAGAALAADRLRRRRAAGQGRSGQRPARSGRPGQRAGGGVKPPPGG